MKRTLNATIIGISLLLVLASFFRIGAQAQADDPSPPEETVKLIFIHHSTGENWLMDDYGNLGLELAANNYYVSDTNYGWGLDTIGDRTDITNWLEWFRSPDSDRYLSALYNENGQNSWYTRLPNDPGGENEIIMFKSCFPNSNLEGNPDDNPAPGEGLTVSNAKFIYNDLLNYFITRPDKLFVVITAPPVQDPTYAENARAFNQWLVHDWLAENNYPFSNVVVLDFYNILTHADNHHWYHDGQVGHITSHGTNTLYYDSEGDDHPNIVGSQKATTEYVPVLNVFYHRWRAGMPAQPPPDSDIIPTSPPPTTQTGTSPSEETQSPAIDLSQHMAEDIIDDFESGPPSNTLGWEAFWDDSTSTSITCVRDTSTSYNGQHSILFDFDVEANSWATCALLYDVPIDWQFAEGLSFYLRSSAPTLVFDIILYGGTPDDRATFLFSLETPPESVDTWVIIELTWDNFLRAEWEENAGASFGPNKVTGIAVGINTYPDTRNTGMIWIDDVRLMSGASPIESTQPETTDELLAVSPTDTTLEADTQDTREESNPITPCSSTIALPLVILLGFTFKRVVKEKSLPSGRLFRK